MHACINGFLLRPSPEAWQSPPTGAETVTRQLLRAATQRHGGETMTSVSVGQVILTLTEPVRSGDIMSSVSAGQIILTLLDPRFKHLLPTGWTSDEYHATH